MRKYEMQADCGCCTEELLFNSDEEALEAVRKVGLRNGGKIIDSTGREVDGLDTFYGIWLSEDNAGVA